MRLIRSLIAALATGTFTIGALAAAEPAVPLELSLSDVPRLVQRWNASLYAKLWNDPLAADLRAAFADKLAGAEMELGWSPLDALLAFKSGGVRFLGLVDKNQPQFAMQADAGAFAEKLFALIAKTNPEVANVPGADGSARAAKDPGTIFARFRTVLTAGVNLGGAARPWAVAPDDADLVVDLDVAKLMAAIAASLKGKEKADFDATTAPFAGQLANTRYQITLVPEGIHERMVQERPAAVALPVDRGLLARLPATTLMAGAVGLDGKQVWALFGRPVMAGIAKQEMQGNASPDDAEEMVNLQLVDMGISTPLHEIVEKTSGTLLFAITASAPFPAISIALPRSPGIDQLAKWASGFLHVAVPAEGASTVLPIPNLPMAVNLVLDHGHWLLTTDLALAGTWAGGAAGGWADAPAGKLALAKAPADAFLIGASDTPSVLRTIAAFLPLAFQAQPNLAPQDRQKIMQGVSKLAAIAGTGYLVAGNVGQTMVVEGRGLFGASFFAPALVAAVAIPNLLESRVGADSAAAAAMLKVALFPAEIQFQSGGYIDQDGDKIGEYGFISEMAGKRPLPTLPVGSMSLIVGPLATGTIHGYRFAVFLPDGKGGAIGEPAAPGLRPANPAAANDQEKRFVAYAWPVGPESGATMYAITPDGQVREAPWTGEAPAWNALYNGGDWSTPPAWPIWHR